MTYKFYESDKRINASLVELCMRSYIGGTLQTDLIFLPHFSAGEKNRSVRRVYWRSTWILNSKLFNCDWVTDYIQAAKTLLNINIM